MFPDIVGMDNVEAPSILLLGYFQLSHWESIFGFSDHMILFFMIPLFNQLSLVIQDCPFMINEMIINTDQEVLLGI